MYGLGITGVSCELVPRLWQERRQAAACGRGLCARVRACAGAGAAKSLHIHTYMPGRVVLRSATASVRTLLEKSLGTGVPTAAPPTEHRYLLPWRTRARPMQLHQDPPRQPDVASLCQRFSDLFTEGHQSQLANTRIGYRTAVEKCKRRRHQWQTSSAARRVPTVAQG